PGVFLSEGFRGVVGGQEPEEVAAEPPVDDAEGQAPGERPESEPGQARRQRVAPTQTVEEEVVRRQERDERDQKQLGVQERRGADAGGDKRETPPPPPRRQGQEAEGRQEEGVVDAVVVVPADRRQERRGAAEEQHPEYGGPATDRLLERHVKRAQGN